MIFDLPIISWQCKNEISEMLHSQLNFPVSEPRFRGGSVFVWSGDLAETQPGPSSLHLDFRMDAPADLKMG